MIVDVAGTGDGSSAAASSSRGAAPVAVITSFLAERSPLSPLRRSRWGKSPLTQASRVREASFVRCFAGWTSASEH